MTTDSRYRRLASKADAEALLLGWPFSVQVEAGLSNAVGYTCMSCLPRDK